MNQEKILDVWKNYKNLFFAEKSPYDEKYKWNILKQVSEKWDWDAEDKIGMFTAAFEVKGNNNLWTSVNYYPVAMAKWFFKDFPEETVNAFNALFKEEDELLSRLNSFKIYFDNQLRHLQSRYPEQKLKYHSQDIRTMSLYLFLQNPDKYALFKYSFVKSFAERFGFGSIRKGQHQNYITYLNIVKQIKELINNDVFIKEYQLNNSEKQLFNDNSLHLLIQDFMYCTVNYSEDQQKKYWLYSPGEQAYKWQEFYDSNIIALGWDELNDLNSYENKTEISKALHRSYGGSENKPNDTTANDDFINSMEVGDFVIVKKGRKILKGYGVITSDYFFDEDRADYKHCRKMEWITSGDWCVADHSMVLKTLTDITSYDSGFDDGTKYYEYLLSIMNNIAISENKNFYQQLLKYKKQIILQGPPGTGKTREAKLIARELISLSENYIQKKIFKNLELSTVKGKTKYLVVENTKNIITLQREKGTTNVISYSTIISAFSEKKWNHVTDNNDDRMAVAIAKYLHDEFLKENEQFKLIQFHPSYTYEDFVRGIVAKPNPEGEGIIYDAENKTLGHFAKRALKNYKDSLSLSIKRDNDKDFDFYVAEVLNKIDEEEKYMISDKVYIYFTDNNRFKYKGDNWSAHPKGLNMNFSELKKIISLGLNTRQEINKNETLNSLTRQHATYYQNVIDLYKKFILQQPAAAEKTPELQNYILVIDEINRANLSSVLGELIYALEYRNESVESMYEVDGSNTLILPPNLYIIGTMNTADRSVGHIDYAIRRRFAFVDVLPEDLSIKLGDAQFYSVLFNMVKNLFTSDEYVTNSVFLSEEFKPKDVTLGHSYFIDKAEEGGDIKTRWNYEIKPILLEYVRDGVLKTSASDEILLIEKNLELQYN